MQNKSIHPGCCEVCGNPVPRKVAAAALGPRRNPSGAINGPKGGRPWSCRCCGTKNRPQIPLCAKCGTLKTARPSTALADSAEIAHHIYGPQNSNDGAKHSKTNDGAKQSQISNLQSQIPNRKATT